MLEEKKTPQLTTGMHPFTDHFRREMETMMSRFFGGPTTFQPMDTAAQRTGFPSLDMTGAISPAVDINETDAEIVLTAELPGLGEDDVDIEIKDRRLTLCGQKKIEYDDNSNLYVSERSYGSFVRAMTLPETVDIEKITAEFDKGVLHIKMPKTEPRDPSRKITVSSK
ncbi:Hsp20/alpha crystallin family protein [Ruegeria arenilitoris]|uniref:Hsp20/alpha crystallin family protein n=1 Tax=Ruegeria arenilitoris TaxID=1173585 RepID=UPI001481A890|nr:Hsp20/alpha crystallin family protein [Ruegeria arenilitoris]